METKSKQMRKFLGFILIAFICFSCQEKFIPDFADEEPTVVIEGYIQAGDAAAPVIVSLSKTFPLFQSDTIKGPELFLGGATMTVEGNGKSVELTEICSNNLDPAIKELLLNTLGLDSAFLEFDLCFYTDLLNEISAEVGEEYKLTVDFEGEVLTSYTTIPGFIPIDSFNIVDPGAFETSRQLSGFLTDPPGLNFYRLKIGLNNGPLRNQFSVVDDVLFDNRSFEFPINNQPDPTDEEFDPITAGLYEIGDSILIQWQTIDEAQFDFWNTLEFARSNQGPFASYTRADSNIEGGIGIWGGSSVGYYNVVIE